MSIETGVVLAAGEGTRLRPLTRNRPKPMLPAGNRPILEYVLDALVEAGVSELVLVVGYRRDRVQEHFGPKYREVPVSYVRQEKQLGSGHALLQARDVCDGPFLAVNGDRVIDPGIVASVVDAFDGTPTLGVIEHPHASRYGAVSLDGERLAEIVEKPDEDAHRLINAGVYVFDTTVFDAIEATDRRDGEIGLTDTINRYVEEGTPVRAVRTGGAWVDVAYPWDLLVVARELLAEGWVEETQVAPDVYVATSAIVHDRADLHGPVVVGPDAEVAAGAVVGPDTAVGRNATVGANATVAGSVLDADARVGPGSTLVDCVAGQSVDLGAGTLVPGGPADVRVGTEIHEDQRLGAVFADRVVAEGGVTAVPGTLVGPNARLGTGTTVDGTVREDAEVVR